MENDPALTQLIWMSKYMPKLLISANYDGNNVKNSYNKILSESAEELKESKKEGFPEQVAKLIVFEKLEVFTADQIEKLFLIGKKLKLTPTTTAVLKEAEKTVEKSKLVGENHQQAVFKPVTSGFWSHLLVQLASPQRDILMTTHKISPQVLENISQIVSNNQLGASVLWESYDKLISKNTKILTELHILFFQGINSYGTHEYEQDMPHQLQNMITVDSIKSFPVPNLLDYTSTYTTFYLIHIKWFVRAHDYFQHTRRSILEAIPQCFCKFLEFWSIRMQGGKLKESSVFMKTMNSPFQSVITRSMDVVEQIMSGTLTFQDFSGFCQSTDKMWLHNFEVQKIEAILESSSIMDKKTKHFDTEEWTSTNVQWADDNDPVIPKEIVFKENDVRGKDYLKNCANKVDNQFLQYYQAENALSTSYFTKVLDDVRNIALTNQFDLYLNTLDQIPYVYLSPRFGQWINLTPAERVSIISAALYLQKNGKFQCKTSFYAKSDKQLIPSMVLTDCKNGAQGVNQEVTRLVNQIFSASEITRLLAKERSATMEIKNSQYAIVRAKTQAEANNRYLKIYFKVLLACINFDPPQARTLTDLYRERRIPNDHQMAKALSAYTVSFGGGINNIVSQVNEWADAQEVFEKQKGTGVTVEETKTSYVAPVPSEQQLQAQYQKEKKLQPQIPTSDLKSERKTFTFRDRTPDNRQRSKSPYAKKKDLAYHAAIKEWNQNPSLKSQYPFAKLYWKDQRKIFQRENPITRAPAKTGQKNDNSQDQIMKKI